MLLPVSFPDASLAAGQLVPPVKCCWPIWGSTVPASAKSTARAPAGHALFPASWSVNSSGDCRIRRAMLDSALSTSLSMSEIVKR